MLRVLSVIGMLVLVFIVALGGTMAGNSLSANSAAQNTSSAQPGSDAQGLGGKDGAPGADGVVGKDGAPAKDGAPGADGARGAAGSAGPAGAVGSRGSAGAPGAVGAQGPVGPQGAPGADGADGSDGADGAPGADGNVNVRLVEETSLQAVNTVPRTVLEFNPALTAGKWLLEVYWTPWEGTFGTCDLVSPGGEETISSGLARVVDLSSNTDVRVTCKSSGHAFLFKDFWMRATRVTA